MFLEEEDHRREGRVASSRTGISGTFRWKRGEGYKKNT